MIIALKWIQKNPWKTFLICACAFVIPLLLVHICYSFELSWISSKWSAGDVLGYIAGFETCLGTMVLRGKLRAAETAAYFRRYSLPDCACGHQTAHNHYDEQRASVTC